MRIGYSTSEFKKSISLYDHPIMDCSTRAYLTVVPHADPLLQSSYRSPSSQITLSAHQTRTFLTQLRREAQALKEQPISPSAPLPKHGKQPKPNLSLTNLPYFVRRTGSNQLPVYLVTKAGGTKQLTKIQKTEGDLDSLRSDLAHTLGVDTRSPDVSINRLTGHIIVKVCSIYTLPLPQEFRWT